MASQVTQPRLLKLEALEHLAQRRVVARAVSARIAVACGRLQIGLTVSRRRALRQPFERLAQVVADRRQPIRRGVPRPACRACRIASATSRRFFGPTLGTPGMFVDGIAREREADRAPGRRARRTSASTPASSSVSLVIVLTSFDAGRDQLREDPCRTSR
jgi:hypothetical protein